MARSLGNSIADSLELGVDYAEKLLKDVTADKFARLAAPGGLPIQSNHGAFIYGHLSLYAPQVTMHLGDGAPEIVIPDGFEKLFSKDATCVDDPAGDIYPSQEQVAQCFIDGYRQTCAALREVRRCINYRIWYTESGIHSRAVYMQPSSLCSLCLCVV